MDTVTWVPIEMPVLGSLDFQQILKCSGPHIEEQGQSGESVVPTSPQNLLNTLSNLQNLGPILDMESESLVLELYFTGSLGDYYANSCVRSTVNSGPREACPLKAHTRYRSRGSLFSEHPVA